MRIVRPTGARRHLSTLLLAAALFVPRAALAEPGAPAGNGRPGRPTTPERDADAYCRWVRAIAASSSDVLIAPAVYATGGYVSGADISQGAAAVPPTARIIAAGTYSFGGLNRGLAMRAQADAECRRYSANARLHAYIEHNRDAVSARALAAKIKVLDGALARAQDILGHEKALLAQSRLTVDEIEGTQLRVDSLRQLAAQAHQQLDAVASVPPTPHKSIRDAVNERDAAEVDVEHEDGRVRASYGWDLAVRGGLDKIYGVTDNAPYFVTATLTLSLGWLFQGSANSDAREARRDWVRAQVEGDDDRVEQVVQRLRSVRTEERSRSRETATLVADLRARLKEVEAIASEKARTFADLVWFDLVRAESDYAYFTEHLRELDELIGDGEGAP